MVPEDAYYVFLLDLFPLLDEVGVNNRVLSSAIESLALSGLRSPSTECLQELALLLSLSRDLGCASPEVIEYLLRQVDRLRLR